MTQTAVEWIIQELKDLGNYTYSLEKLLEQAKEMEKQQIIDAYNEIYTSTGEQYYNKKFKKE